MSEVRDFFSNAKKALDSLEKRIGRTVSKATISATDVIDSFCNFLGKVDGEIPVITNDLNNPFIKALVAQLGGTEYLDDVIAILNRVAPLLKKIEGDKVVFEGAIHHVGAEILLVTHKAIGTMENAIDAIQQTFMPNDAIPTSTLTTTKQ